jgi:hypothetical protein
MKRPFWSAFFALVLAFVAASAACGGSNGESAFNPNAGSGDDGGAGDDATTMGDGPSLFGGDSGPFDANQPLVISPANVTVQVKLGQSPTIPTQAFTATYGGALVAPQWTVDRGEIGAIDVASGVFTPTANLGGVATITAAYQGHMATTHVTVKILNVAAGDPNPPDAGTGAGGFGGVGGSGEGQGANAGQQGILDGTPTADPAVTFLYPYDKTVFPRGILPPLLQWTVDGAHPFDAFRIHLTEANYEYKGYFQKPADPFQNHPVPQSVWNAIAYSNGGEDVQVELVFANTAEGKAYGPITETWKIAQGTLKGTIYYNSYGTNLAQNMCCTYAANGPFGGATLAIKEGATDPVLVAGKSTANPQSDYSGCRVCHSVSADGSQLLTQHGDSYATSSTYALTKANAETTIPNSNDGRFTYPALYPNGSLILTHESTSALYNLDGTSANATGIPSGTSLYLPAFSPDGKHVAFSDGTNIGTIDFALATKTFSNLQAGVAPAPANQHAYWPSWLPTNDSFVFHVETVSNGRDTAGTRSQCDQKGPTACQNEGAHAELWWWKGGKVARLDNLNGKGYLPAHPSYGGSNGDDSTLNYEPTVNPVPSGGYAWVVFTSRRLYGNVATINPFWSDPRFEDLSSTPTTKKLWVAAIDLNAPAGTDPSHPAFYLPAQELLAGNARGFWVVDPCHPDGTTCQTGDECCGGYCRPGDGGGLVCTAQQPSCAEEFEKCTTNADCCGVAQGIQCINGRCAQPGPK